MTIGFLTDRMYFSLPVDMYRGIERAATEHNIGVISFSGSILNSRQAYYRQANILYSLVSKNVVDGVIIASNIISHSTDDDDLIHFCKNYKDLPLVSLGRILEGIPSIIPENKPGMYEEINHMIKVHNRKKIAFICGLEKNNDAIERLEAYKEALADNGIKADPDLILPGNFQPQSGAEAVLMLLNNRKKIPGRDFNAIIAANDYMARAALIELQKFGIKIPEDVAVAGFDDIFPIKCLTPPLSSVYIPFEEIGVKAVGIIIDKLKNRPVKDVYRIKAHTSFKQSCGCSWKEMEHLNSSRLIPEHIKKMIIENPDKILEQINIDIVNKEIPSFELIGWADLIDSLRINLPDRKTENLIEQEQTAGKKLWKALAQSLYVTFQRKRVSLDFLSLSQELSRTVQLPEITAILTKRLPSMGINQCFLVLYEKAPEYDFPQQLPEKSKLILAVDYDNICELPETGLLFPTNQLLPEEFLSCLEGKPIIIEALYFQEKQIGYVLLEAGSDNERIYSDLQIQISSSMQGALLVRKVQENAGQLKEANEQIRILNNQLNEENLEMKAEMKVAEKIQTALLPKENELKHSDFEITGCMYPAKEVGGDYYDVINDKNGTLWLGIGDVSGHGVTPGLIMMMTQTMHSLVTRNYDITPKDLLIMINRILHNNVTERLNEQKYMTFTSLKYLGSGKFQFAGLHQDMIIYRKSRKRCELIETAGTWLNIAPEIDNMTENGEFSLESGDLLILYTDGITESFNRKKEMYGLDRLVKCVTNNSEKDIKLLEKALIDDVLEWNSGYFSDDMTLVILKKK